MANSGIFDLRRNHREATVDLARLNREMAIQMIMLASETGEKKPLIDAVISLRRAEQLFEQETTPIENAEIHKKLGDVLLGYWQKRRRYGSLGLRHPGLPVRDYIGVAARR